MIPQESFTPVHRIPPHNKDAEQCVLGAILQQQGILPKTIDVLQPDDFYFQANKLIFIAMLALFEKNEPQDLITVSNYLKSTNKLNEAGGPAYLASLTDLVPLASNIVYYARIVREKSVLRRLIATSTDIASRCYEQQEDIDKLLDEVEQTVFEIARDKGGENFEPLSKIITKAFERVTSLAERNSGDMKWKKFIYHFYCKSEGIYVCPVPSCAECADHAKCFSPEV